MLAGRPAPQRAADARTGLRLFSSSSRSKPTDNLVFALGARLAAHISGWIVNDDGAAIGQRFDRVAGIARCNPHYTGSSNPLHALNGQFEFTFDDLVDFLLRVKMFMNGRTAFEVVATIFSAHLDSAPTEQNTRPNG